MESKITKEQRKLNLLNYNIDRYERQMRDINEKYERDKTLEFRDLIKEYPWNHLFEANPKDKYGRPRSYTKEQIMDAIDGWNMDVITIMKSELDAFKKELNEIIEANRIDLTETPPKSRKSSMKRKRSPSGRNNTTKKTLKWRTKFVLIPFDPKTGRDIPGETPIIIPNDASRVKIGRGTWLKTFGANVHISREAVEVYDAQDGDLAVFALRPTIKYRTTSSGDWKKIDMEFAVNLLAGSQVLLLQDVLAFRVEILDITGLL